MASSISGKLDLLPGDGPDLLGQLAQVRNHPADRFGDLLQGAR